MKIRSSTSLRLLPEPMFDDLRLADVDRFFGDVRGEVGDPFEIPADENEAHGLVDSLRAIRHTARQLVQDLVVESVDFVVALAHLAGGHWGAPAKTLDAGAQHPCRKLVHTDDSVNRTNIRQAGQRDTRLGNIDPMVADAFKVVVDLNDADEETQVSRGRLMPRNECHRAFFYVH